MELTTHTSAPGFTDMGWDIGQQGQVSCPLYCSRQGTLMLGAGASLATRIYLRPIRYIGAQFSRVFVVYGLSVITTKGTNPTLGRISGPVPLGTPRSTRSLFSHLSPIPSSHYNGMSSAPHSPMPASSALSSGRGTAACLSRNVTLLAITSVR